MWILFEIGDDTMFAYLNTALCFLFTIIFFAIRNHPNGLCGIRVRCTMENTQIWKKVHTIASVAGIPCCLLDLYALLFLTSDSFLILSWIGVIAPIGAGCITAAILRNIQDKQEEQEEERQRKAAEQEESSPKFSRNI